MRTIESKYLKYIMFFLCINISFPIFSNAAQNRSKPHNSTSLNLARSQQGAPKQISAKQENHNNNIQNNNIDQNKQNAVSNMMMPQAPLGTNNDQNVDINSLRVANNGRTPGVVLLPDPQSNPSQVYYYSSDDNALPGGIKGWHYIMSASEYFDQYKEKPVLTASPGTQVLPPSQSNLGPGMIQNAETTNSFTSANNNSIVPNQQLNTNQIQNPNTAILNDSSTLQNMTYSQGNSQQYAAQPVHINNNQNSLQQYTQQPPAPPVFPQANTPSQTNNIDGFVVIRGKPFTITPSSAEQMSTIVGQQMNK